MWTEECEAAFLKLKEYLAATPVLCKPQMGVPPRLYFAVTERGISSVLVQEQDQTQKLIYFVSKVLQGPEARYQALEKAAGRGVLGQEAPSLLPKLHGGGDDEPPYPESAAKARRGMEDGSLGGGTVRVRRPV